MTIKEIKIRIKSVKSIKKITKAMQMVSASKLRYIINQLDLSKKYIKLVNSLYSGKEDLVTSLGNDTKNLMVLISADRGLCGSHSSGLVKYYLNFSETLKRNSDLLIIGSKAYDSLKKITNRSILLKIVNLFKKNFLLSELVAVGNKIFKVAINSDYEVLSIIYNKYISSVSNQVDKLDIKLSLDLKKDLETVQYQNGLNNFLIFYIVSVLYASICHSKACEESIRMTSMDNATTSADELINDLTRLYNMSRQASITTELIEIISGAESLKQGKN